MDIKNSLLDYMRYSWNGMVTCEEWMKKRLAQKKNWNGVHMEEEEKEESEDLEICGCSK